MPEQSKYLFKTALLLLILLVITLPVLADDYQIGSGDVLSITVYDHDELKTKVRVSDNGNIEFPLIGNVHVGGLKISAASEKIGALLADGYIVAPQVQIYIEEFKSKKVIILGQVRNPGVIELRGATSLLELISNVGGLQKDAGETVTVTREVNGQQKKITVDLKTLIESGKSAANIEILGGDTVSIAVAKDSASICYITGQVNRPGAYPCGENSTILKMVSLAGGFTGIAAESSVKINRIADGEKQVLKDVELDTLVLSDDVIEVPESFF